MKTLVFSFLILLPLLLTAREVNYSELKELQRIALIDRLGLILDSRKEIYQKCAGVEDKKRIEQWAEFTAKANFNLAKNRVRLYENIKNLIEEIKYSKNLSTNCKLNKSHTIVKSIRKHFILSKNTETNNILNNSWFRQLEPACFKIRQKGNLKSVDQNACFAGDRIIYFNAKKHNFDIVLSALNLSYSLLAQIASASEGQRLNIEDAYFSEFKNSNKLIFFTILAAISTSGPSGLTGWLQGLEDRLLVEDLNSNLDTEEIIERFEKLQLAKFNYIKYRELASKHRIKLSLYSYDVSEWNRHNTMALFLACSKRNQFGSQTVPLVYSTGLIYEAKDFISHLQDGVDVKLSKANFSQDTNRYQESGMIGYNLCKE